MADKRSKSILGSLKNMLHRDSEKPAASPRKKSAAPKAEKPAPAPPPADAPAAKEGTADAKPEKKKVPNQPWYRHRQRW